MNLYLDNAPKEEFFKLGAFAARLSEAPENWPQELTSELMRQLPYLTDYELNVNLQTVEPGRGFAFGFADVTNKTERPEEEHAEAGIPHIRIPIIIIERAVKPFNVYMDGEKVVPLTEDRLRETLFNPQTFDLTTSLPKDPSLVESMAPPQRGFGMGGQYKTASAEEIFAHFLTKEAISPGTIERATKKAVELGRMNTARGIVTKATKAGAGQEVGTLAKSKHLGALRGYEQGMISGMPRTAPSPASRMHEGWGSGLPQAKAAPRAPAPSGPGGTQLMQGTVAARPPAQAAASAAPVAQEGTKVIRAPAPQPQQAAAPTQHVTPLHPNALDTARKIAPKVLGLGGAGLAGEEVGRRHEKRKAASVLHAIAPTIRESDAESFVEKVSSDPTLQAGFRRAGVAQDLVEVFENTKRASANDRLDALLDSIEPTVVTFLKLPGGDFLVKSAATKAFAGDKKAKGEVVPQEEVAGAIGQENAQAMQPGQSATAVVDPVEPTPPPEVNAKPVDEFGEWLVQDTMGNSLLGWVFPQTLAWDGEFSPQPISLFTNGSAYAFQDQVSGELVGKGSTLPVDAPRGDGVFYCIEGRHALCTAPITIGSAVAGPDGSQQFIGNDVWGNQVHVSIVDGVKEPIRISDVEYAIPTSWKFMRLNQQTELASDPGQMSKAAMARAEGTSATIIYNGGFHIRGGCGLDKLASEFTNDLDAVGVEFLLGILGVDGITSKAKIAEARKKGSIKLANLKTITTISERYSDAVKTASAMLSKIPDLRKDLIKEAASLEDEGSVNNLLALNFINPENLHTFINYLPELEQTSEKLAEMWLYSVLGMKEIEEQPVDRAMKNLEEVIQGLKSIAQYGG